MPLPTFLILGAQKCGTTSLTATLRGHRELHMPSPKELHYFDRPRKHHDLQWYADQFTPESQHAAWGEATPSYIFLDSARRRIATALPEARFVVLLRDPAQRAHSHFWHNHRLGVETTTSFEEALDLEHERMHAGKSLDRKRYSYVTRGRYVEQLAAMEALVGRERLHVALLEDLATDRAATLASMLAFLGVDPGAAASLPDKRRLPKRGLQGIADSYDPMTQGTRARLVSELTPSIRQLEEWLGRDLSTWRTV